MPLPKNKKNGQHAKLDRRVKVARGYLAGKTQSELASELGVTQACISLDLKAIRVEWRESALIDFNEARARELARDRARGTGRVGSMAPIV
ncbi:MAG: hypothetical protein JWO38_1100 [Gemmataceae bacterium]|nr:hypothetical protein [Gemmataceae bacterium]